MNTTLIQNETETTIETLPASPWASREMFTLGRLFEADNRNDVCLSARRKSLGNGRLATLDEVDADNLKIGMNIQRLGFDFLESIHLEEAATLNPPELDQDDKFNVDPCPLTERAQMEGFLDGAITLLERGPRPEVATDFE